MTYKAYMLGMILWATCLYSCNSSSTGDANTDQSASIVSPVTVTHIVRAPMSEKVPLNAVSVFQKKSVIKATVNGYIEKEMISPGQVVHQGALLFVLKTKEARAMDGVQVDSTLAFTGVVTLRAAQDGYVSQLDHQQGDYVMDGDQLGIISDRNSFVFLLDVPFELTGHLVIGRGCEIILPGGKTVPGRIASKIPAVDPQSQSQRFVVKVSDGEQLPENLIAKINIATSVVEDAQVLPKTALLTSEDQTAWWVMKLINDSTAIKIPVQKGIESDSAVQILSPDFLSSDRILTSGNYGLPDTALVKIVAP